MQKSRLKSFLKIIFVIILLICINKTNGTARKVTLFEEALSNLVTLPERAIFYIKSAFKDDKEIVFKNIENLKNENENLKTEIERLNNEMIDYEMVVAENDDLKSYIALKEQYPNYETIIADVIMASSSNWDIVYTINKGEKDGIGPNMAVINKDGLIGYVETVTSSTAKVVCILDAGNSISARVTRTRDVVVAKGNLSLAGDKEMKITNIPMGVSLVEGDRIETSGLGGIYPKGIIIGKVKSFEQKNNPLENEAILESFVNFDKLETVAVIKTN